MLHELDHEEIEHLLLIDFGKPPEKVKTTAAKLQPFSANSVVSYPCSTILSAVL
jgi:hypothetical protein